AGREGEVGVGLLRPGGRLTGAALSSRLTELGATPAAIGTASHCRTRRLLDSQDRPKAAGSSAAPSSTFSLGRKSLGAACFRQIACYFSRSTREKRAGSSLNKRRQCPGDSFAGASPVYDSQSPTPMSVLTLSRISSASASSCFRRASRNFATRARRVS